MERNEEKVNITNSNDEREFIKHLMEREAEAKQLENEINAYKKKIKQIKKSNTWKKTHKLRKLVPEKVEREAYIKELEEAVSMLETEVLYLKDSLKEKELAQSEMDYQSIWRLAREKKEDGSIMEHLNTLIETKKLRDTNYVQFLQAVARLFMNEPAPYKKMVYEKILSGLKQEEIPEFIVRAGLSHESVSLQQAASFRGSLTARMRKLQLTGNIPEMVLDDKKIGYAFAQILGLRIPKISSQVYKREEIEEQEKIVIKPVDAAGGRGVYLVRRKSDIIDIREGKTVPDFDTLRQKMNDDLQTGRVAEDEWLVEQLILEDESTMTPARDVKFYCFYGKVGLILEIVRYPEMRHCWWTSDGERLATGKYAHSSFKGKGVAEEEIALAEQISQEIPAPFIRIDFLRSHDGLVFGEFTPKPGNYDDFNDEVDRLLGDYFLEAESRLFEDLFNGKQFHKYKTILEGNNN